MEQQGFLKQTIVLRNKFNLLSDDKKGKTIESIDYKYFINRSSFIGGKYWRYPAPLNHLVLNFPIPTFTFITCFVNGRSTICRIYKRKFSYLISCLVNFEKSLGSVKKRAESDWEKKKRHTLLQLSYLSLVSHVWHVCHSLWTHSPFSSSKGTLKKYSTLYMYVHMY